MKTLRYPFLLVLAMALFTGCSALGLGQQPPTPTPFARLTAETVLAALAGSGGPTVSNIQRDVTVGRGAPSGFSDRYVFDITVERATSADLGGQVLIFQSPDAMAEWQAYVTSLRNDSETRRSVIYVYEAANVIVQLSADLTPDEARPFQEAIAALG